MDEQQQGYLRIGELSQRTGVSPELLRAWQRRYGLLQPERSPGGFRLYSTRDEARIRTMQQHLAAGVAAAEAARLAMRAEPDRPPETASGSLDGLRDELGQTLEGFNEATAHRVLDSAISSFSVDAVISELLIPYLHELGDRWERGEITVAQEHFASNLIRGRLLTLARSWDAGYGPRALLACPEGELHDLGLVLFGVALGKRGWRVTFLGANTPLSTLALTAHQIDPAAVVLVTSDPAHLEGHHEALQALGREHRLILAGEGARASAEAIGVEFFDLDPVTGAERLAASPS